MLPGEIGCIIALDNGLTGTATRKWNFIFTNTVIERHSLGIQSIENDQMETIDIIPESLRIEYTNNTATMP